MSWVADVVLTFSLAEIFDEDEIHLENVAALDTINAWLEGRHGAQLLEISDKAGGNQPMQSSVYGGAFNMLKIEEFVQLVKSQPWVEPENVQLLIKDEQEERFTIYEFREE